MDFDEQLKAMRRGLKEYERQQKIINNFPMDAIRRHQKMMEQISYPSVSKIVNQYNEFQNVISKSKKATKMIEEQQNQINRILNAPIYDWIKNINHICSVYSDSSINALFKHFKNLPDNYIITEKKVNEDISYVIKDIETDEQLPISDSTGTFGILDMFGNISEKEIFDFYNHLSKYPMLGLKHEIGQKIIKNIEESCLNEKSEITLFRARIRKEGQDRPYPEPEMFEPPYGKSSHGRYNPPGLNVLYTCDCLEGALKEVKPEDGMTIDIIEWKIVGNIEMLDLSGIDCPLINYCSFSPDTDYKIKPAYLVPNFIAQCCDLLGVEGLIYKSDLVETATNYVFFSPSKRLFEFVKMHKKTY